jgi:hypothetical protein
MVHDSAVLVCLYVPMYAKCAQCHTDEASTNTPLPYSKWTIWYKQYTCASYKAKNGPETILKLLRAHTTWRTYAHIARC